MKIDYESRAVATWGRAHRREVSIGSKCALVIVGSCLPISVQFVGELFIGELILLLYVAAQLVCRPTLIERWPKYMKTLMLSLAVSMVGYVISDIIVGTNLHNLTRGWARLFFTGVDLVGIYMLVESSGVRLIWLLIGRSSAGVALGIMALQHESFLLSWKLQLGYAVTALSLCPLLLRQKSRRYIAPAVLICWGAISVALDCRSMGAIFIACGCLQLSKASDTRRWKQLAYLVTFVFLAGGVAILGYIYHSGRAEYSSRRAESNSERLAGIIIGVQEIERSPFVGRGSWAGYTDASLDEYKSALSNKDSVKHKLTTQTVATHSQFLQLWFEGGLLGIAFGVYFGLLLIRAMRAFRAEGAANTPAVLLVRLLLLISAWALLFNPFSGGERADIAVTVAAISVLLSNRLLELPKGSGAITSRYFRPSHTCSVGRPVV